MINTHRISAGGGARESIPGRSSSRLLMIGLVYIREPTDENMASTGGMYVCLREYEIDILVHHNIESDREDFLLCIHLIRNFEN